MVGIVVGVVIGLVVGEVVVGTVVGIELRVVEGALVIMTLNVGLNVGKSDGLSDGLSLGISLGVSKGLTLRIGKILGLLLGLSLNNGLVDGKGDRNEGAILAKAIRGTSTGGIGPVDVGLIIATLGWLVMLGAALGVLVGSLLLGTTLDIGSLDGFSLRLTMGTNEGTCNIGDSGIELGFSLGR